MKKSRNIIAGIMAVCLMGTVIPKSIAAELSMTATASTEILKYKYLNYKILTDDNEEKYIEITGCDFATVNAEIPPEIDGIPVTSIGEKAFYDHLNLKTIIIPEGIKTIKYLAFYLCSLAEVIVPKSVISIADSAFSSSVWKITILNPECDIYYSSSTLGYSYDRVIYGYVGSTAQEYAHSYNLNYQSFYDINNDDLIDAVDASLVLGEYAALSTNGQSELLSKQRYVSDINGDGFTDAVDATLILSYYAEISTGKDIDFYDFINNPEE